jgi:hypothetical protein
MAATDSEPEWERIARSQLEQTAKRAGGDVEQAIRLLGVNIGRRTADGDDLRNAREAIEAAIYTLEDDMAAAVEDVESSRGVWYIRNRGVAADYLGVTMDQVNEAECGATVELGTEEIRALCNGSGVQVETPGGIDVELLPAQPGEVNPGP